MDKSGALFGPLTLINGEIRSGFNAQFRPVIVLSHLGQTRSQKVARGDKMLENFYQSTFAICSDFPEKSRILEQETPLVLTASRAINFYFPILLLAAWVETRIRKFHFFLTFPLAKMLRGPNYGPGPGAP